MSGTVVVQVSSWTIHLEFESPLQGMDCYIAKASSSDNVNHKTWTQNLLIAIVISDHLQCKLWTHKRKGFLILQIHWDVTSFDWDVWNINPKHKQHISSDCRFIGMWQALIGTDPKMWETDLRLVSRWLKCTNSQKYHFALTISLIKSISLAFRLTFLGTHPILSTQTLMGLTTPSVGHVSRNEVL